ncbi:hypothetical protein [Streptomyces syringium]|uniref:hypothetical protein n=1 Tax=Streptomyces syringium TaxID=76729 RepID=UPI003AACA6A3
MGLSIDWTEYENLSDREEYDAVGQLIDQVKALVAAHRAEVVHRMTRQQEDKEVAAILGISRQRVGQLRVRHEQSMNNLTMDYGSWGTYSDGSSRTLPAYIEEVLGAQGDLNLGDFDTDAIAEEYRAAINSALPEGISLSGSTFHGPVPMADGIRDEIRGVVAAVDLWEIIARHDQNA